MADTNPLLGPLVKWSGWQSARIHQFLFHPFIVNNLMRQHTPLNYIFLMEKTQASSLVRFSLKEVSCSIFSFKQNLCTLLYSSSLTWKKKLEISMWPMLNVTQMPYGCQQENSERPGKRTFVGLPLGHYPWFRCMVGCENLDSVNLFYDQY